MTGYYEYSNEPSGSIKGLKLAASKGLHSEDVVRWSKN
jgi:hypothetical protein